VSIAVALMLPSLRPSLRAWSPTVRNFQVAWLTKDGPDLTHMSQPEKTRCGTNLQHKGSFCGHKWATGLR
jgi:hypothetical protein